MYSNKTAIENIQSQSNFKFSNHTTYGLGGSAKIAYFPKTEEEAAVVFDFVKSNFEKYIILGNGSNILASDNMFDGAVICTKYMCGIYAEGNNIRCLSGTSSASILSFCLKYGFGGLEYLVGIPATIGGLTCMNGGVNSFHLENNVESVRLYDGNFIDLSNENCNFSNKHSTMRNINTVVTSILLKINYSTSDEVKQSIEKFRQSSITQPEGKSCGCVFKNPVGFSAGKLIDEAGLKGYSFGCAKISTNHANFIINYGNRAQDIYTLIKQVKHKVFEKFGVLLEEEVVYIGEFNDFDS